MGRGSGQDSGGGAKPRGSSGIDPSQLEKGTFWKHPKFRDRWRLESAGEKIITLKPTLPFLKRQRIPREEFLSSDWYKV